jgi:hypothetical protein
MQTYAMKCFYSLLLGLLIFAYERAGNGGACIQARAESVECGGGGVRIR